MEDPNVRELQAEMAIVKAELAQLRHRPAARIERWLAGLAGSRRARVAAAAAALGIATASYAATVTLPHTFVNGTIADATQVNANFDALAVESNDQDSRLAALEGQVGINTSRIATNTTDITAVQIDVATNTSNIGTNTTDIGKLQADLAANAVDITTNSAGIAANASAVGALDATFAGVSRNGSLLTFGGMNVQVVDGSGDTGGVVNGLGNLIVGYNENSVSATRTGSHNLVVGIDHEYTSYGGLVAGGQNTISGGYSSVGGGWGNRATSSWSSISGGASNTASGFLASVGGGQSNTATGSYASISGGRSNSANGSYASINGGNGNTAGGAYSSISAGQGVDASSDYDWMAGGAGLTGQLFTFSGVNVQVVDGSGDTDGAVNGLGNLIVGYNEIGVTAPRTGSHNLVVGIDHAYTGYAGFVAGERNRIDGSASSVSGGYQNTASGNWASVSGGWANTASGNYASISGGQFNQATAVTSSVSGGGNNVVSEQISSISGGAWNSATGQGASVSGGMRNTASGAAASVPGGIENTASGLTSTVGGGESNEAAGESSSVAGGQGNYGGNVCSGGSNPGARCLDDGDCTGGGTCNTNTQQSVSGGSSNTASGERASVGGGATRTATGAYDWAAGSLWENN